MTMHDFMQSNELKAQAKRLLGFRFPLFLVLLVNVVLLARVPSAANPAAPDQHVPPAATTPLAVVSAEPASPDANVLPRTTDDAAPPASSSRASGAAPSSSADQDPSLPTPDLAWNAWRQLAQQDLERWSGAARWALQRAQRAADQLRQQQADFLAVHQAPQTPLPPVARDGASARLTLANPLENGGLVQLLVNGQFCQLAPGVSQQFPAADHWRIQFHRGGDFGEVDRTVTPGSYQFTVSSSGWELQIAP